MLGRRLELSEQDETDDDVSRAEISILRRLLQLSELGATIADKRSVLLEASVSTTYPDLAVKLRRKYAAEAQVLASRLRKSVHLGTDGVDVSLSSTREMDAARKRQLVDAALDSPEKLDDGDVLRSLIAAWPTSY